MPIPTATQDPRFCAYATLNSIVTRSIGCQMFPEWFVEEGDEICDVAKGGPVSGVVYVSSLLTICGLLPGVYTGAGILLAALEENGWAKCRPNSLKAIMAVAVWGEPGNEHVGFNTPGSGIAISCLPSPAYPMVHSEVRRHGLVLEDGRTIREKWTHPRLCRDLPKMGGRREHP